MNGFTETRTRRVSRVGRASRVSLLLAVCWICTLAPGCGGGDASSEAEPQDMGRPDEGAVTPLQEAPKIPENAPKIAFLGDSISAGLHLAKDEAYPSVLQRLLAKRGLPFHLVNAGTSGATTAAGLNSVNWLLGQKPKLVVVQLGANDGFRGIPLATIEKNLRGIIGRIEKAKAQPVLLEMRLPPNYSAEYTKGFADLFEKLAKDTSAKLVPFFMQGVAGHPEMNLRDGIHPNPAGHERIARNLESAFVELLK